MFFPQLVAGPIERPQNLLGQFRETHRFDYDRVTNGLKLMVWGLFKKVVVADRVAAVVSAIYSTPEGYSGLPLLLATGLFAVQIYCDFSGYSDIAIGAAQVLGFRLMVNFRRPYAARSLPEFWQRWHISLSTWFRDYVFLPLAYRLSAATTADRVLGIDVSTWAYAGATGVTMVVAGLWHGANWTFVIWGSLLGALLIVSALTRSVRRRAVRASGLARVPRLHGAVRLLWTFSVVCLAWVFFRAQTTSDALLILDRMARFSGETLHGLVTLDADSLRAALESAEWRYIGATKAGLLVSLGCVAALFGIERLSRTGDVVAAVNARPRSVQWAFYQAVAWSVFVLGNFGEIDFIYFQF
jgi:D-alanyl-lipoteichoic acid acyltransferase DltB (MBOAT superfamily)